MSCYTSFIISVMHNMQCFYFDGPCGKLSPKTQDAPNPLRILVSNSEVNFSCYWLHISAWEDLSSFQRRYIIDFKILHKK